VVDILGGTVRRRRAYSPRCASARPRAWRPRDQRAVRKHRFLVAQHMAQFELTGEAPPPMSVKRPAWSVYDIFETADGDRLFVGVVTDTQWEIFCREFQESELAADPRCAATATA
jgi:hypothetical protein